MMEEVRANTKTKIRATKQLADRIRWLRDWKAVRELNEAEKMELDHKLEMAQNILGMSGAFDLQEILDGLEQYIINLEATQG